MKRVVSISHDDWSHILGLYTGFKRERMLFNVRSGRLISRKTFLNNYIQSASADFLP